MKKRKIKYGEFLGQNKTILDYTFQENHELHYYRVDLKIEVDTVHYTMYMNLSLKWDCSSDILPFRFGEFNIYKFSQWFPVQVKNKATASVLSFLSQ